MKSPQLVMIIPFPEMASGFSYTLWFVSVRFDETRSTVGETTFDHVKQDCIPLILCRDAVAV